jgi:Zn-dependent protease
VACALALAAATLDGFTVVSLFWALLNLVPVVPLDGGRLCQAWLGAGKQRLALTISLVCSVALAMLSFQDQLWLGLQNSVLAFLDIRAGTRVGGGMCSRSFSSACWHGIAGSNYGTSRKFRG